MGYNPGTGGGSGGGADIVQYPVGGPWPSRPSTSADIIWVSSDPTAGNPSGALTGDLVVLPTIEALPFALSDEKTTAISAETSRLTFRVPYACTVVNARASLGTASSSGALQIDLNKNGTTMLSTKLFIEQGAKTSKTAATQPVFSTTSLADDDEITVDIDAGGTGAKGLKLVLYGYK